MHFHILMSPSVMITGQTIDFNCHCNYEFGEYVQTHEQHGNSMSLRTIWAPALRPTGNAQDLIISLAYQLEK
jgi:hypothetical protein